MNPRHLLPLLLAVAAPLFAQPGAPAPAAPEAPPAVAPAPAAPVPRPDVVVVAPAPAPAEAKKNADTLQVAFENEDIRVIIGTVADLFDLNVYMPDSLQGKATVKLRNVTWKEIFQLVLSQVGYTYVDEGNIIKIVSQEALAQEPTTTDVFLINYAKAADLKPTLDPLASAPGEKIVVDARINALVITARPSVMAKLKPIIQSLDKATDQVMIESKFVEVTDRDLKNIGVNWASLNNYQLGASGLQQTFDRTRNNSTGGGNDSSTGSGTGTGTTNNNTSTNANSTNITFGTTPSTAITTANGSTSTGTTTSSANAATALNAFTELANTNVATWATTAVFSADAFNLVLSALSSQNEVKLVSNPTIVTLNNIEAKILIGQKYPVAKPQYNQETGQIYYDIETQDIGVQLIVTPQVNSQGFIKLKIHPIVSSLAGTTTIPGGAEYPILATREAVSEVTLKDGFTMGIGGLIENTTSKGETKVPLLGSIPGLGRLFRSNSNSSDKRNLVIFITAKTLSAEGAPIEQIFDSRAIRSLNMTRDELPGYRDGSDPFVKPPAPKADTAKKPDSASKPVAPTPNRR